MDSKNRDLSLSLLCGFLAGLFLILIVKNPTIKELQVVNNYGALVWLLPFVLAIVFFIGVLVARFIFGKLAIMMQLVRFAESGVLNTLIDFGVINLLIWMTGVTSGAWIFAMNVVSFALATINSYFWNKFWTFNKKESVKGVEFLSFIVVSLIGAGLNSGIVYFGTTYVTPLFGVSAGLWVNMAKLMATLVSMVWNFVGYKFIVFK